MMAQAHSSAREPRVVVLGGGFGGLAAVRALKHVPVQVTLVDKNNHHSFQPLLYQVATAGLEAPKIGFPLRTLLRKQANADVLMTEAESIDPPVADCAAQRRQHARLRLSNRGNWR